MWDFQEYIYLLSWDTKSQAEKALEALAEFGSLDEMDVGVAKPPSGEASV